MPGITNVSITTGGKWQTLLQADIEFICYDLDQLETMSKLYMSLGCTVFLEWGNTNYFKNDNTFEINPLPLDFFNENSKESLRKKTTNKIINTQGNYESIIGTVYNFSYSANSDGSYNCKTNIMGAGGLVESLRINSATNYDFDIYSEKADESEKFSSILENALYTIKKFILLVDQANIKREKDNTAQTINVVNFSTSISFSKFGLKFKNTYGELLNRIFSETNYKGPGFNATTTFTSNLNVLYGNPWSLLAGYEEAINFNPILKEFYYGYRSTPVIDTEDSDASPMTYITLGHLMALIQHLGIFTEGSENSKSPVVYIDYNPDATIIKRGVIEASVDPGKCLIPHSSTPLKQNAFFDPYLLTSPKGTYPWSELGSAFYNLLGDAKSKNLVNKAIGKDSFEGKLFDVLINIDFALNSLTNLSKNSEDRNVNLMEYIDTILSGVNVSLGKVNALRTFYDDKSNCIRIIDENYNSKLIENKKESVLTLENFGTKSTVYDYSYSSKITPKLAAQIVISAQALDSGGIKGFSEDVLSYQKLNGDIVDKFAISKYPAIPPKLDDSPSNRNNKSSLKRLHEHLFNVYILKDIKSETISSLTTLYADLQNVADKIVNKTPTLLIPLEYQITLDGISGILPYTIFRLPDSRLPKRYRGKVDFVVFSINHSIENNKWYTTLRGQTLIRN
jgi:hypothetical protein